MGAKQVNLNRYGTERTFLCLGTVEVEFEHFRSLVSISTLDIVPVWVTYSSEELSDMHIDMLKAYLLSLNLLKHGQALEVLYV